MKTCTEKGTEKGKYEIQKSKNRKLKINKIQCLNAAFEKQKQSHYSFLKPFKHLFLFLKCRFFNFHYFCLCQKEILARDI